MKCSFESCDNLVQTEAHGLCVGHHAQKFRYKIELRPLRPRMKNSGKKCIAKNCTDNAASLNLCKYHKGQHDRGVAIENMRDKPVKTECATWWCHKPATKSIICGTCAARARGYNLEYEEYAKLPRTCEICGKGGRIHLDHDHETGKFRGVLCQGCNTGIGQFYEDVQVMQVAIEYLEFWKN